MEPGRVPLALQGQDQSEQRLAASTSRFGSLEAMQSQFSQAPCERLRAAYGSALRKRPARRTASTTAARP